MKWKQSVTLYDSMTRYLRRSLIELMGLLENTHYTGIKRQLPLHTLVEAIISVSDHRQTYIFWGAVNHTITWKKQRKQPLPPPPPSTKHISTSTKILGAGPAQQMIFGSLPGDPRKFFTLLCQRIVLKMQKKCIGYF